MPEGALTAELTVRIDGELLPSTTTTPLTFSPATATAGPTLTMDTRPAVTPPVGYLSAELSLNTVALNLNGLVTEAAAGAVNPPVAFVRQSPLCTTVTATLAANARGTATAASAFPQGVKDCPASPDLVSVVPDPTNPRAFTFTMKPPTAAVAGRTASLEYVFGDGAKPSREPARRTRTRSPARSSRWSPCSTAPAREAPRCRSRSARLPCAASRRRATSSSAR